MVLEELKKKRLKAGLSQDALAQEIGIARTTLTLIELGMRKPSYDVMVKISTALNEPIEIKGKTHKKKG